MENILNKHTTAISNFNIIPSTGGIFDIHINDELIFSKKKENRFPNDMEIEEIVEKILNK